MLTELNTLLESNGLLVKKPICDLVSSCCNSQKEVIDFDVLKDKYCKRRGVKKMPKSADALLLEDIQEKTRITFVEMKDLSVFMEDLKANGNTDEFSVEQLLLLLLANDFEADRKMIDSFALLMTVAKDCGINNAFYPFLLSEDCDKKFLFVLKISARDFVRFRFQILAIKKRFDYWVFGEVNFITANEFDRRYPIE